jgi:hypothetical protein
MTRLVLHGIKGDGMKKLVFVLLICLFTCFGVRELRAEYGAERAATTAAQAWLALTDGRDYNSSWKEASSYFRGAITEQNWVASMEGFRAPLGKMLSRRVSKTQESNSLPGAPDGRYILMRFSTSFEKKKSAVETVTFVFDDDGKWRAAGYFIR